ncbi:MAG: hypothetical protein V3U16_01165 [Candidatus Neomarinimicrobiota bacterium]
MKHSKTYFIILLLFLFTLTAVTAQESDEWITTESFSYSVEEFDDLEVNFSYGLGSLEINPNESSPTIEGMVKYNERDVRPVAKFDSYGNTGVFTIKVRDKDEIRRHKKHRRDDDDDDDHYEYDFEFNDLRFGKLKDRHENEMDFTLPTNIRTDLSLDFGLGSAELDLSNIRISNLVIDCGLSKVEIEINERNPIKCKSIHIDNGLGDLSASGLGNIRSEYISIDVGLGSADIDLRGEDITDMEVDVDVGLGSMDMILPGDANIRIYVNDSFLSSVNVIGLVKKKKKEWVSSDWRNSRPTIEVDVSIGMGSIDIYLDD